jgi:hypothetical protein
MDFLSLYLYNILIKKVFIASLIYFFIPRELPATKDSSTFSLEIVGMVEFIQRVLRLLRRICMYSGISGRVNGKVVEKRSQDLIPVFSMHRISE